MNSEKFNELMNIGWEEVFSDPCVLEASPESKHLLNDKTYENKWLLDGDVAFVRNSHEGMHLTAGPQLLNDDHHMVLWTKEEFSGDMRIDFDYIRTDFLAVGVNILYIQATGMDNPPYAKDIFEWNDLRKTPSMAMYHDYMNTYHVSFAAFPDQLDPSSDYVRARRYIPKGSEVEDGMGAGLSNTDLEPDYFNTGLFKPGVLHKFTVIKKDQTISMRIICEGKEHYFNWTNTKAPPITEGRVGFRLMFGRSMTLKNVKIMSNKNNIL